jgi:5'-nucleotidase
MNILLSNDDGFLAPGINQLREALLQFSTVTMIAPDQDRSGASNSLTLNMPLRLKEHGQRIYSVNGTPTDAVHLGLTALFAHKEPDIVIAGINAGANLGDDVLYSGTVAAAMEGRFLGCPAIAISSASFQPQHFDSAIRVIKQLLSQINDYPNNANMILNVNVPDLPWQEIKGLQVTRLGQRHRAEPVYKQKDPRGKDIYWVGPPGAEQDAGQGTDFYAIKQGFVSITPIHIDLTRHQALAHTKHWVDNITHEKNTG